MEVDFDSAGRIKKLATLAKAMNKQHVFAAVSQYKASNGNIPTYIDSTGYDLLVDGERFPPKAIFGLALSPVLQMEVLSSHFVGGVGSSCFKILEKLGFEIVNKPRPSEANGLAIYSSYTREQLNSIFDPDLKYTAGSGRWGGSGIVPNAPLENDFAFIVTLDDQANYEDYLTEDGILFWKSQNRQGNDDKWINAFCEHDPTENVIYLFMRVSANEPYTYFGPLAFVDRDIATSNPVHFQWELLSWPLPDRVRQHFSPHIRAPLNPFYQPVTTKGLELKEVTPPIPTKKEKPQAEKKRPSNKNPVDWALRDQINRELGLAGEKLVIDYEKASLIKAGRKDLADRVEHIALADPSAGYDIISFEIDGSDKHIEVKTTKGSATTPFYISRNEVETSHRLGKQYWVYRVFGFKEVSNTPLSFYSKNGTVEENFDLVSENYKAVIKSL
ncbi:TPA: DUF3427 domain-containing protein [Vibrio fluvialis]|nr:DUF3427 domain-containing protein [Vibrio fluvialis]